MHVVLVAAEAAPFAKVGGLADVATSLSTALQQLGIRVTLVLPYYRGLQSLDLYRHQLPSALSVRLGDTEECVEIWEGNLPDTTVRLLAMRHDAFFDRPGIYAEPQTEAAYTDNAMRYAYLCRAATHALAAIGETVDILHLNDHHTALAVGFAREDPGIRDFFANTGMVFSIHNLGYQGLYDIDTLTGFGLPQPWFLPGGPLEFWGQLNFMKLALELSDALTTVSPRYALEIQESNEFGFGLEGVLRQRSADLVGILNGIDLSLWDPASDPLIAAPFSAEDPSGKQICKKDLQEKMGLPHSDSPLIGVISRLVSQKGIDLILECLPQLVQRRLQLVFLGQGTAKLERSIVRAVRQYPTRVACRIGFDEALAHQIEAGSDFFLMPSRYEPCGLNQMYSQRYGTLPIVRRTGGLADTVQEWQGARGSGNGFLFDEMTPTALLHAVDRAGRAYDSPDDLAQLRRNAMRTDFSWERSARRYLEVYSKAQHAAAKRVMRARAVQRLPGH